MFETKSRSDPDGNNIVLKFFLNVSKEEQKKRFLERVEEPDKNWKFSAADINERSRFDEYMTAYEDMFNHTSTVNAPWYIIPADHKWFARLAVVSAIYHTLDRLHLAFPRMTPEQEDELLKAKAAMEAEEPDTGKSSKRRKKDAGKNK